MDFKIKRIKGKYRLPLALKITLLLASCGIFGSVIAVFVSKSISPFYLKLYIGLLVLIIGIVMLTTLNRHGRFSWKKITFLGLIALFNKGISGGGYGPIVTGGQILSGVDGKNAVSITALAEGLTSIVAVSAYMLLYSGIDWALAPYLIIGTALSVPLSAHTVKLLKTKNLRVIIGTVTILVGSVTLWKTLF